VGRLNGCSRGNPPKANSCNIDFETLVHHALIVSVLDNGNHVLTDTDPVMVNVNMNNPTKLRQEDLMHGAYGPFAFDHRPRRPRDPEVSKP
jgi:hypothetical protein